MITIQEIADLAGVSRGTVDRVLNNRGNVKAETASKIREIAGKLDYKPNKLGQALSIKKRNLCFGYILYSTPEDNPFFTQVVEGIECKAKELEEYGVTVLIRYAELDNKDKQIELIDELVATGINGLAITPLDDDDVTKKLVELANLGIPCVTVNSDLKDSKRIAYVGSEYMKSGQTAGALMRIATEGDARIGVVIGSSKILCHTERVRGFKENLEKYAPSAKIVETVKNHDDDIESFEVVSMLLQNHPEINALYLASGGVYGACRAVKSFKSGANNDIKIIAHDCIATTEELIEEGIITATVCQQPKIQGSLPLDLLFEYVGMDITPQDEINYTQIEIKIRENM